MIDVDGLKFINDTFGHRYGDEMLKATAELLRSFVRKNDIVARIGGEEFTVLLPEASIKIAQQKCQLLSQNLKSYNKTHKYSPLYFSIGLATSKDITEPLRNVLEKADLNSSLKLSAHFCPLRTRKPSKIKGMV